MQLTGDEVKVEVVNDGSLVHLVLRSAAGGATALLTPGDALAIAQGLTEAALEIAENPGGEWN